MADASSMARPSTSILTKGAKARSALKVYGATLVSWRYCFDSENSKEDFGGRKYDVRVQTQHGGRDSQVNLVC